MDFISFRPTKEDLQFKRIHNEIYDLARIEWEKIIKSMWLTKEILNERKI